MGTKLTGTDALVTGVSGGVGEAVARALRRHSAWATHVRLLAHP